ncbi:hypothetical protein OH492_26890 [Vibrio chagasii]|nr:hypothetical protein [Vibrio chagasii]
MRRLNPVSIKGMRSFTNATMLKNTGTPDLKSSLETWQNESQNVPDNVPRFVTLNEKSSVQLEAGKSLATRHCVVSFGIKEDDARQSRWGQLLATAIDLCDN